MDYNKAALEMHETHKGKVGIVSKVEVATRDDLSTAYTPGVAEPCRKIKENPDDVYKYTFKGNMVAVVSNGTAVLGLGDIGPEAGLPVMEGKAVLFKEFGGVDAFPICIDAHDAASVIAACKAIAPTFGGINLEDIKSPECFEIEETLERELDIPVFQMGDREDPVRIAAEGVKLAEQKGYDMVITGERRDEGGMRSVPRKDNTSLCFTETSSGQYRLRPLYYVSDADKAWYKEYYGLRYSDAYEVYGLTRTGCCGCPISYKAIADLELIRPYEPNLVKAAWNIFGKSYEYRQKYNAYKAERMEREKTAKKKAASGE